MARVAREQIEVSLMSAQAGRVVSSTPACDAPAQTPIRVVAADDSYLIRESLTATLGAAPEIELVGVCSNGKELEACVAAEQPAVVILDIRMPPSGGDEGVRVANRLRETDP